jgi:glutamate carboxypeptidase
MPQQPTADTYAQQYLPLFQSYQNEYLQRLASLVNIDSGTGQIDGIAQIMSYLERWLTELGCEVALYPTDLFGPNLVARRTGKGSTRILLVGHIDTVYGPDATRTRPFSVQDGVAYGPGVIDMKCGVVLCLYTIRALIESGFDSYGELCVVINNDEEVGSPGSAPLLRDLARQVDVGLVLESSRNGEILTHARKGADKYVLEVRGVSAHSGAEPHKGRSAVVELAHKILAIQNLHTLFPGVTFNVTRLSSTEPLNIVPDMARCHISVRAHTDEGLNRAANALEQIAAGCAVPDTSTTLTRARGRRPYRATPEVLKLVQMAQIEGEGLGWQIISEGKGGVSDANLLMEAGIPALDSLGPVGGGMHNLTLEHLKLESVPLRGALLAGLIQRISLSKLTGREPSS